MPKNPGRTALYRLFDAQDTLLYVGIAEDPKSRWAQHAADKTWWPQVTRRDIEWLPDRKLAEEAERSAIEGEGPIHNTRHAAPHLSSQEVAALFAQYKATVKLERQLRPKVKQAAGQEMLTGATVGQLAKATGLTPEVFRRMARDLGIERLRPPTVGKLKPEGDVS
ncbi:GIY-YIG nuclease family protein [Streptomyces sp. NPDC057552]|uniref:GIY-YIG nuclease family protein n=1 Tax=Streptomyces sp. NPDC057552 TaxID=3350537 RepID=UPI003680CD27